MWPFKRSQSGQSVLGEECSVTVGLPHDMDIIDKTVLPAPIDTAGRVHFCGMYDSWIFRRKLVLTMKCKKCGKVVQVTESNP